MNLFHGHGMHHTLSPVALRSALAALLAVATSVRAEVAIEQAVDKSVGITTSVYTAQIDANGNLAELSVKGAKGLAHQFGDPGKPPAGAPSINIVGQVVAVRSGTARVEWTFGEDTVGFLTEGYNFECLLDPAVKAIVAPNGGGGALGKYSGGCTAMVLANDLTIASKVPMHVHERRFIPAGYISGGIKPGAQIANELRLGTPADAAKLLDGVRIRPHDHTGRPLSVNEQVLPTPMPANTPHVITLVQRNFGKADQSAEYRVAVREKRESGKEVLAATLQTVLPGEAVEEQIVSLPALPPGSYVLTAAAWQAGAMVKESKLEFAVGADGPAPVVTTAPTIPASVPLGLWADRRPVSQLFLSQNHHRTPANPDGYLNKEQDTVTPAGKAAFRKNLLAYADTCIGIIKEAGSQGMIVWDLEGYSRPGFVYVGDPRLLPTYAPAMDAVADDFFRKFSDAGLRTGVTIRPIKIFPIEGEENIKKWGTMGYVLYDDQKDDVAKEIGDRIAYAKKRWGCTLFYMDSNGYETWENGKKKGVTIPARMLETLRDMHPDVLIIPEHATPGGYGWAGQYAELRMGSKGTPAEERHKHPGAITVLSCGGASDELVFANWEAVAANVARGDALFMEGWYPSGGNRMVKDLYRQAEWLRKPVAPPSDASVADLQALAKNDDPATRFFAVRAVAAKADPAAASALAAVLETERDWLVRKEAIAALGAIKTPEAVAALVSELKKAAPGHSYFAREQVRQLGAEALPVAMELARSEKRQNRIDAASLLRTILTKPALDALRALAQDKDPFVKDRAVGHLTARLGS
ncbi:MAG: HEAT repeat domain-containing protein [Planctomycetota bacterium]